MEDAQPVASTSSAPVYDPALAFLGLSDSRYGSEEAFTGDEGGPDDGDAGPSNKKKRCRRYSRVAFSSASFTLATRKRNRKALSCVACKKRKIKCDRQQPCAPCSSP